MPKGDSGSSANSDAPPILSLMNTLIELLNGKKAYIGAIGLMALGVYELTQGQLEKGLQDIMAGFGLLGLRHAVAKSA